MEVGDAERGGRGGGSHEKGTNKVINELAKVNGKVKTKYLKLRVLKSPLKHFQLFSLYNLHGGFDDYSQ